MQQFRISASKEYFVKIGQNLLENLGAEAAAVILGRSAVLVSDSNVWPLYGQRAVRTLEQAGFSVERFVFPAGESGKSAETYVKLLNFLAEHHLTRTDCLIALGGGVVGDVTGFAAATYLRGISYIQVPTTLLAMVDSSVGGKTAIDLPAGKNLAGAFYQPALVLCDIETLDSLPPAVFAGGCGEVIKYAMVFDENLFSRLEREGLSFRREEVIGRCVELKRSIVMQDEFDTGKRMLLNFGHTLGHAIEAQSGFTVSHGHAVAVGMAVFTRATRNEDLAQRLEKLLAQFSLPCRTDFSAAQLLRHIDSDKKRSGDQITLVLPAAVGCCHLKTIPVSQLETIIKAGM